MVSDARRAVLDGQTHHLAALLEEAGVPARQDASVVAIGAVTGIVTPVSPWRPIRFLPAVASRDRRPMLNALRYWIEKVHPRSRYLRYGVITHGDLVPAFGDLRKALQTLARDVSKWADEADERYGIVVHFRGSEFTRKSATERELDPERYPGDPVLYHPHANVLLEPTRLLPKEGPGSWSKFLEWTHEFFGAHWEDNGRIKNVRELVKYVVKPGDLVEGAKPLDSREARWLHESLFRLNLAQPLGAFRTYWKTLADSKRKVAAVRAKNGRGRLHVVPKATRLNHSRPRPHQQSGDECNEGVAAKAASLGAPANTILGVTLPQWKHTPWAEPLILVQNYEPKPWGQASKDRLAEVDYERHAARKAWDAAGAPEPAVALRVARAWRAGGKAIVTPFRRDPREAAAGSYRVHNSSLTVRDEVRHEGGVERSHRPPDLGGATFLKLPGRPSIEIESTFINIFDAPERSEGRGVAA